MTFTLKVTRGHCRGGSVPDCDPLGSNIYHAKFHALFTMGLTALLKCVRALNVYQN